ncbi:putative aldehyde dehydrogenase FUS7 [Penicillium atrosanguineum]|uniref:aldehyde dehydrogenase (NAD(+)) n=1 Tax=Penicillium atrosanguineum TaxID=1132637 RepID=A0A9W9U730_9EURO|nr:putative aldehyde dehydrogenase FUS7 [Penicillium atrosanguineum]
MVELDFEVYKNVIGGQLKGGTENYHGINPFTEEKLWPAPIATEEDLEEAVKAASLAFQTWQHTSVEERRRRVNDFSDALGAQKDIWVPIISKETATLDLPEYTTQDDEEVKVTTKYYPLGVVGAICPWNFPVFLAAGRIASAVSTGNTIIIKPSPFTPYTILKLVELAQHFFPAGVIQALGGNDDLGPWMTTHPGITKITFTGSSATGKKVMAAPAPTLKRVTLELHAGQTCIAAKRIYVQASIYDEFMKKFTEECKKLIPGKLDLSPIQNKLQYEKVKSLFADCQNQGYEFALGGPDFKQEIPGYFIPAAIVDNPPEQSHVVQDEPFGPIAPVLKWEDEEEVIQCANGTDQGLGATLWCRNTEQAERIALRLEAGSVWVNRGVVPLPTALFGGIKQSGLGGEWGQLGLLNYCSARTFHFAKNF